MAHVHKPVRMSAVEIEAAVRAYNREPFQELLALLLEVTPTRDEIQAFANRHPDRWVRVIVMLAELAGYSRPAVTDASVAVNIHMLSDAALLARLAAAESRLEGIAVST